MKTIEVIISPKGETKIETRGFAGSACLHASQFLEQALGIKLTDKPTADFYQQSATQQAVQQGGGP